jgi:iron complex outermembrane receptor protein
MKSALFTTTALALALPLSAQAADAPAPAAEAPAVAPDIIVTGTRTTGTRAADSAAPIEIVSSAAFQSVGQPDLNQVLQQTLPSLNLSSYGADTANLTLTAALRGLSPNDTLVLVNGKRRHGTSNLAVDSGSPYTGSATTDLSFIPTASIARIEVLQDGAAAQYGSDAIAGVVNIILKDADHGGSWNVTGGQYYEGDGKSVSTSLNDGMKLGDRGYLNLTAEYRFHDFSQRGGCDARYYNEDCTISTTNPVIVAGLNANPFAPRVNTIVGDARYSLINLAFNAGYDISDGIKFYAFGSYGNRDAKSYENYRSAARISAVTSTGATVYPFPAGFNPLESIREEDFSLTAGFKGTASGWNWDLSQTYGRDSNAFYTLDSVNGALYSAEQLQSPTVIIPQRNFYDGTLVSSEWSTDLDVTREFDAGLAKPITLAFGGQYRYDRFEIQAGETGSWYAGGSASYAGFEPGDASVNGRKSYSLYGDLAIQPVLALKIDLATRFEHYSDFGSVLTGKATARYDFSPAFALRSTVSTGFRAPTLAEEYYSSTNVGPTSIFAQIPSDSTAAQALGFPALKPERATNISAGFVAHPASKLQITADYYYIALRNRIVGSGSIYGYSSGYNPGGCTATGTGATPICGVVSQTVLNSLAARGIVAQSGSEALTSEGLNLFANGANTHTNGVEATANYTSDFADGGHASWSLGFNYNTTKATYLANLPASVTNAAFGQVGLLTPTAIDALTTATPKVKTILGALISKGLFSINLRETIYGSVSQRVSGDGVTYTPTHIGTSAITDLNVSYKLTSFLRLDAGANNLLNMKAPTMPNLGGSPADGGHVFDAPLAITPWGIDGGYYYAKATFTF